MTTTETTNEQMKVAYCPLCNYNLEVPANMYGTTGLCPVCSQRTLFLSKKDLRAAQEAEKLKLEVEENNRRKLEEEKQRIEWEEKERTRQDNFIAEWDKRFAYLEKQSPVLLVVGLGRVAKALGTLMALQLSIPLVLAFLGAVAGGCASAGQPVGIAVCIILAVVFSFLLFIWVCVCVSDIIQVGKMMEGTNKIDLNGITKNNN